MDKLMNPGVTDLSSHTWIHQFVQHCKTAGAAGSCCLDPVSASCSSYLCPSGCGSSQTRRCRATAWWWRWRSGPAGPGRAGRSRCGRRSLRRSWSSRRVRRRWRSWAETSQSVAACGLILSGLRYRTSTTGTESSPAIWPSRDRIWPSLPGDTSSRCTNSVETTKPQTETRSESSPHHIHSVPPQLQRSKL